MSAWKQADTHSALVLSGGGARGAYQAGVLAGLLDLGLIDPKNRWPFPLLVGSSAGAINATALAAGADEPEQGIARLVEVWSNVQASDVFRTDLRAFSGIGIRWARDISLGGLIGKVAPKALLDTRPLRATLESWIPFDRIAANLRSRTLSGLVIAATDLYTGTGVFFVEGMPGRSLWEQTRRRAERAVIAVDHVLASSAIPLLFPPVPIDDRWFGDGSIRNTAPLSPAMRLGARRILAISVREPLAVDNPRAANVPPPAPSIAEITGALLDAVMLDAIELDVEHSGRVNTSVQRCEQHLPGQPFRFVDVLAIHPSQDVAAMAAELIARAPTALRYLMRGLGSEEAITKLTSYLLFDRVFCQRLIELGREDVKANRSEIERFFSEPEIQGEPEA